MKLKLEVIFNNKMKSATIALAIATTLFTLAGLPILAGIFCGITMISLMVLIVIKGRAF